MRTYTRTIDGQEVEATVDVTGYQPAEPESWDCPASPAEAEFEVTRLVVDGVEVDLQGELVDQVYRLLADEVTRDEERAAAEARADHAADLRAFADEDAAAWRDGRGW